MPKRRSAFLHWALGSLEHKKPETGSAALLCFLCIIASAAMAAGEWHSIKGHILVRSFYRLAVHGAFPFTCLILWQTWVHRKSQWLASLAAALTLLPLAWRFLGAHGARDIRDEPALLIVPTLLGALLAFLAARHSGEDLRSWGLGIGDWRWWLPRTGITLGLVVVACVIMTLTFDSLANFYPAGAFAKKNWTNFSLRHLGIAMDFLGWEFLFRGLLLFGFYRRGDPWTAIWVQAIPFFLLHYDRPGIEMALSLVGGALAGWFTLRARSIYPLVIIHFVQITTVGAVAQLLRI